MADCLEIFIGNMPDKGKDEFFRNHYFYRFFICALVMVAEQDGIPVIVDDPLEGNRSPLHVTANVLQERLDIGSATFRGIHVEAFGILCVGLLQQGWASFFSSGVSVRRNSFSTAFCQWTRSNLYGI